MIFLEFADSIKSQFSGNATVSYLNPVVTYHVQLIHKNENFSEILREFKIADTYSFDKEVLMTLAEKMGLDQTSQRHLAKISEILGIRQAWVALQQNRIVNQHKFEIDFLLSKEEAIDLAILTLGLNHPWIHQKIDQIKNEDHPDPNDFSEPVEAWHNFNHRQSLNNKDPNDPVWKAHLEKFSQYKEKQNSLKLNIRYWIKEFNFENGSFKSMLEAEKHLAELDIAVAKQQIIDLHTKYMQEKEKQETIIRKAKKPIKDYLTQHTNKNQNEIKENQAIRSDVIKEFTSKWITSLINVLGIETSASLAELTSINKMTWWRWHNKKKEPSISTLSKIFDEKVINNDKFEGIYLKDLPTVPTFEELIALKKSACISTSPEPQ